MKKIINIITGAALALSLMACGGIETGNVGVRTASFTAAVEMEEVHEGFYTSWLSSVDEFSAREITVEVNDLQPKAADNLTLADLDAEVYYQVEASQIAELYVQFAGKSAWDSNVGVWYPAYTLVRSLTREAIYKATSEFDSLELHKNRDALAVRVRDILVSKLEERAAGVFTVTGVVIRNAKTDSSVEKAIKLAVTKDKELEAALKQEGINEALARSNLALQASLTPSILRMRELDVMEKAVESGSQPLVMFGGGGATPLINIPARQ